jgi:hypothetical protein
MNFRILSASLAAYPHLPNPSPSKPEHIKALIHEKSAYLLQHAHNPVNWLPRSSFGKQLPHHQRRQHRPHG